MPRVDIPNLTPEAIRVEPEVQITPPSFKTSIVTSEHKPLSAFLGYIEGSNVTVDYYSQVLTSSEGLAAPELKQEAIYQQYRLIKGLEIKFDGQLSRSTDSKTQQMDVNGSGYIYPYLKPNKGDAFYMDMGEGLGGRFTITEVTQEYLQKETIYRVNFQLAHMLEKEDFDDMQRKVVETLYFVKDFMMYGQSPLLVEADFIKLKSARSSFKAVLSNYLDEFLSNRFSTIIPPTTTTYSLIDTFAIRAFLQVFEMKDDPRVNRIQVYNDSEIDQYYSTCIWQVLIKPQLFKEKDIWMRAEEANVNLLNVDPIYNSIRYSGFSLFMKPLNPNNNVDDYSGFNSRPLSGYSSLGTGATYYGGSGNALGADGKMKDVCWRRNYYSVNFLSMFPYNPRNELSYIEDWQCRCPCDEENPPTCEDNCGDFTNGYIFDDKFWESEDLRDPFQVIVKKHLLGLSVDVLDIIDLLQSRKLWSRKDRFYKVLVLLIVLKAAMRNM